MMQSKIISSYPAQPTAHNAARTKRRCKIKESFLVVVIAFVMFLIIPSVWAEEEEQAIQEVFQTELVYPQEMGEVQLTLSPRFNKGDSQDIFQIPLTIEYGITDAWQVELEWDAFVNIKPTTGEGTRGIGDMEIGTKYSFMNIADLKLHAAVGAEVSLPTGDEEKGLGTGETEYEGFFILAKDFERLNNSQIFAQVVVEVEDEEVEVGLNAGFFIPFGQLSFSAEFNWSEEQIYLTPGLVWNLPGTWEMGLGMPFGLSDESDDYRVIAMLTYEFNLFEEYDD